LWSSGSTGVLHFLGAELADGGVGRLCWRCFIQLEKVAKNPMVKEGIEKALRGRVLVPMDWVVAVGLRTWRWVLRSRLR
jgi:hypothetical protein